MNSRLRVNLQNLGMPVRSDGQISWPPKTDRILKIIGHAAPGLAGRIDLAGAVVTAYALHAQRAHGDAGHRERVALGHLPGS
jgi:hypothetical protein